MAGTARAKIAQQLAALERQLAVWQAQQTEAQHDHADEDALAYRNTRWLERHADHSWCVIDWQPWMGAWPQVMMLVDRVEDAVMAATSGNASNDQEAARRIDAYLKMLHRKHPLPTSDQAVQRVVLVTRCC